MRNCYQHCVGAWGVQPNEFWSMTLQEYYWLADHHYVQSRIHDKSYVSNDEREQLRELHAAKVATRGSRDGQAR